MPTDVRSLPLVKEASQDLHRLGQASLAKAWRIECQPGGCVLRLDAGRTPLARPLGIRCGPSRDQSCRQVSLEESFGVPPAVLRHGRAVSRGSRTAETMLDCARRLPRSGRPTRPSTRWLPDGKVLRSKPDYRLKKMRPRACERLGPCEPWGVA